MQARRGSPPAGPTAPAGARGPQRPEGAPGRAEDVDPDLGTATCGPGQGCQGRGAAIAGVRQVDAQGRARLHLGQDLPEPQRGRMVEDPVDANDPRPSLRQHGAPSPAASRRSPVSPATRGDPFRSPRMPMPRRPRPTPTESSTAPRVPSDASPGSSGRRRSIGGDRPRMSAGWRGESPPASSPARSAGAHLLRATRPEAFILARSAAALSGAPGGATLERGRRTACASPGRLPTWCGRRPRS
jgi:hypothetical protein